MPAMLTDRSYSVLKNLGLAAPVTTGPTETRNYLEQQEVILLRQQQEQEQQLQQNVNHQHHNNDKLPSSSSSMSSTSSSGTIANNIISSSTITSTTNRSSTTVPARRSANDYRFGKSIGEGSFSTVYLAKDIHTNKEVASKCFNRNYA